MSAFPSKADIERRDGHVYLVPKANSRTAANDRARKIKKALTLALAFRQRRQRVDDPGGALQRLHVGALGSATARFDDVEQAAALRGAPVRDAGERDHDGAPLGERVALVPAQALARVALAAEQSGGFVAGAREPLAAQAAAALPQAMGRVQTHEPHAAVGKARLSQSCSTMGERASSRRVLG